MSEQKTTQQPEQELSEQRRVRREKLAALQAAGEDPFQQTRFDWDATSAQIKEHFDQMEGRAVKVAGRLMSKRGMGKVSFCDLQDRDGRIHIFCAICPNPVDKVSTGHGSTTIFNKQTQ